MSSSSRRTRSTRSTWYCTISGGRVPDAEFLAQFRVVGFEERLVEILDGVLLLELAEEGGPVDAIEDDRRPCRALHRCRAA